MGDLNPKESIIYQFFGGNEGLWDGMGVSESILGKYPKQAALCMMNMRQAILLDTVTALKKKHESP